MAQTPNTWAWIGGSSATDSLGTFGVQGVGSSSNIPSARNVSPVWQDENQNIFLFGGYGLDGFGVEDQLNDLWKFDGTNWTWLSGSKGGGSAGNWGSQGVAASSNIPSARSYVAGAYDSLNRYAYIFGGCQTMGSCSTTGRNDLWRWDGTYWTWISGSSAVNQNGVYGTQGVAAGANHPGARLSAVMWTDSSGRIYVFGGFGRDSVGGVSDENDLWRWDGTNWTWLKGSNLGWSSGSYGVKNVTATSNVPAARKDAQIANCGSQVMLFGGYDSGGNTYNDLWEWDGTNWTWRSGSSSQNQLGTYGTQGVSDSANVPGGRHQGATWCDHYNNFWIFGGEGLDSVGVFGILNDLWKWDGSNWTWINGSSTINGTGAYGSLGVPSASNFPPARDGQVAWRIANTNRLLLFGGWITGNHYYNDLWSFGLPTQ